MLRFGCSTTPPSVSDQFRLEFTCCPRFTQALDSLASRLGKTRSDTIRDALNYYENAVDEWEKGKNPAKADEKSRLIYEFEEAAKKYAEAKKERLVTKKVTEEAGRKYIEVAKRVDNARIVVSACSQRLQDFIYKSYSNEFEQQEEQ